MQEYSSDQTPLYMYLWTHTCTTIFEALLQNTLFAQYLGPSLSGAFYGFTMFFFFFFSFSLVHSQISLHMVDDFNNWYVSNVWLWHCPLISIIWPWPVYPTFDLYLDLEHVIKIKSGLVYAKHWLCRWPLTPTFDPNLLLRPLTKVISSHYSVVRKRWWRCCASCKVPRGRRGIWHTSAH